MLKQMLLKNLFVSFPLQSYLFPAPASVLFPVTTKCGRRGPVSSTPTFFASVPVASFPQNTVSAWIRHTPTLRHPAPLHEYDGMRNSSCRFGGTPYRHTPRGGYRSSIGSWEQTGYRTLGRSATPHNGVLENGRELHDNRFGRVEQRKSVSVLHR